MPPAFEDAANELSVTPRTLQRRNQAVLGKTPVGFIQNIPVERARHLISVAWRTEQVASEAGDADATTLCTLMSRRLGLRPA